MNHKQQKLIMSYLFGFDNHSAHILLIHSGQILLNDHNVTFEVAIREELSEIRI